VAILTVDGATATWTYLTTDHLGTPVLATDSGGAEVWSGGFEPFGADYTTAPSAADAGVFLRLPGQWDDETWQEASLGAEVSYNVYRWYTPNTGRYSRPDPLRWFGSAANTYSYAENQPLLYVDRFGLAPVTNNSDQPIPYKPEDDTVIELCAPGQTCDVDGVYPPSCDDFPIKIVDGCTGQVRADGKLVLRCPLFDAGAPGLKEKFPTLGQILTGGRTNEQFHKDHPDWPIPTGNPSCESDAAPPPAPPQVQDGR
jgi:RHS repeat-associated protein